LLSLEDITFAKGRGGGFWRRACWLGGGSKVRIGRRTGVLGERGGNWWSVGIGNILAFSSN